MNMTETSGRWLFILYFIQSYIGTSVDLSYVTYVLE